MKTALIALLSILSQQQAWGQKYCTSPNNVFHVRVDLFANEVGLYTFEECGDVINPTLGLEVDQVYTFEQKDRSNYFHPFGVAGTSTNTTFLMGSASMEQQAYTFKFVEPTPRWAAYPIFSTRVQFTQADADANTYPYYHCLLHHSMEGKILLLKNGKPATTTASVKTTEAVPFEGYQDSRSPFDQACGSFGLDTFQLPNPLCPDRFVCGTDTVSDELQHFSSCLEAANCAMMSGMTTGVRATDDSSLFVHQMIPHHQNAVNTAKTLLHMGSLLCPDLTDQSNPDCVLEGILREIVAGQNHQIQLMRQFLAAHNFPPEDNCDVYVQTVDSHEQWQEMQDMEFYKQKNSSGAAKWGNLTMTMASAAALLLMQQLVV